MSYDSDVTDLVTRLTDLGIPPEAASFAIAATIIIGKGPEAIILQLLQQYNIDVALSAPILGDAILLGRRALRSLQTGTYEMPDPPRGNGSGMREDQHA